jgi:hypothetical protein
MANLFGSCLQGGLLDQLDKWFALSPADALAGDLFRRSNPSLSDLK